MPTNYLIKQKSAQGSHRIFRTVLQPQEEGEQTGLQNTIPQASPSDHESCTKSAGTNCFNFQESSQRCSKAPSKHPLLSTNSCTFILQ